MATEAQVTAYASAGSGSSAPRTERAAALRSQRELRPGVALALAFSSALAMARLIDVASEGVAMTLFGITYSAAVAVAALVRPRWYLPLVVAYLPYSKAYPLSLGGITGLNLVNLVLVLGPVAWLASRAGTRRRVRLGVTEPLTALYAAAGGFGAVTALLAGHGILEALQNYRAWLAPILLFFLARGLVRDREDVAGILRVLAWTVFLVAALTWKEGLDRAGRGSIDRARVRGLLEQANRMGAFLVYYGVPFLGFALTARGWRKRLPYLAAFLVAARATLFTFSRGAYVAFALGAMTTLALSQPLLLVAGGAGAAAVAVVYPPLIPDSVSTRMAGLSIDRAFDPLQDPDQGLDRSGERRLVLWQGGLQMVARNPLTGVGLNRFAAVVPRYTPKPLSEDDPVDAHNAYLLIAAELGLPTLLLLLLFFAASSFTALRLCLRRRHPIDRGLGLAFLGSLAGVGASCLLGSRFSDESLIGYFWIMAALVVVVGRLREPRPRALRAP